MNKLTFFASLVLVLLFTQCRDGATPEMSYDRQAMAPAAEMKMSDRADANTPPPPPQENLTIERKLIREGNMRFQTADVGKTRNFLDSLLKAYGGYLANENVYNYDGTIEQSLHLRIPSDRFEEFLGRVTSYAGRLDNRYINTLDVTEEFIDVEARLKTKKELEIRYLELLKQARSVEDMVAIETQLAQVRAEIESIQGRLEYLQNRVSFASLTVNFYQPKAEGFGFWDKVDDGWGNGWNKFLGFMVWLVTLWPFVLLLIVLIVVFRIRKARKRNRMD